MGSEVLYDLSPLAKIYKDGRVERFVGEESVPPSLFEKIQSKDVAISSNPAISVRLYIPRMRIGPIQKLPVVVYYHGGGFIVETARSPTYHNYLNALAAEANVVVVSVDYRRAPEDPLPAAYDDSWTALEWVTFHSAGRGPEEWLNYRANLRKVYLAGDSAGANIINNMGIRLGEKKLDGIEVQGVMMVHPYFWGNDALPSETTDEKTRSFYVDFWHAANPTTTGCDDPLINPAMDPRLSSLHWKKALLCVAGKDVLRYRGWHYEGALIESGWRGAVEEMESPGEDHVFHLVNPTCENAVKLMKRLVSFLNEEDK